MDLSAHTCLTAYPNAMRVGDVVDLYGVGQVTLTTLPPARDGIVTASVVERDEPVELYTSEASVVYRLTAGLTAEERGNAETGIPLGTPA